MTIRRLDDFLKYGLGSAKDFRPPRPSARRLEVNDELIARLPTPTDDLSRSAVAVLEWIAHLNAGRIG